jgi:predicted dehydrogenase
MSMRIGVIGAGNVTSSYHMPVLAASEVFRVEWLLDRDEARAAKVAARFGVARTARTIEDAPEVDAVLVATPVGSRREVVAKVAGRRWHAFCEKPFAVTATDHEEMVDAITRRDRCVGVGLVRRFYVSTMTARDVIRRGLLGRLEAVFAGEGFRARKFGRGGDWYQSNSRDSGGVFFETGSHLVDQVLTIVGAEQCELRRCKQTRVSGLEMETRLTASLGLSSGSSVPLTLAVSRLTDIYNGIVLRCANGEVRLGLDPEAGVEICDPAGTTIGTFPGGPKPAIFAAVRSEWLDFAELCARGMSANVDTGLMTTRLIAQAYARASAETHRQSQELS